MAFSKILQRGQPKEKLPKQVQNTAEEQKTDHENLSATHPPGTGLVSHLDRTVTKIPFLEFPWNSIKKWIGISEYTAILHKNGLMGLGHR